MVFLTLQQNLHSNMFLLFHDTTEKDIKYILNLHSNMFLLFRSYIGV